MSYDKPGFTQIEHCTVRCWHRVDYVSPVTQHIEIGVVAFCTESRIVSRNHGITHEDVLIEPLPVVEQRFHKRGSTIPGAPACAMRPGKEGPPSVWGPPVRHQHHTGCERVSISCRSSVIENARRSDSGRQR